MKKARTLICIFLCALFFFSLPVVSYADGSYESGLTDGRKAVLEELLNEILSKYGKKENLFLPNEIVVHENIRNFVEQYSRLEFDEDTIDYDREEILKGEHKEKAFKGFYCIGVCIDYAVWVKKSNDDETIYVYDVDTTERFVPYASNIKYYIIMRYNEWQEFLNDISEESNT